MTKVFEAVFYEGEQGERMPSWDVVEWTNINPTNGSRSGKTVQQFDYEEDAVECAIKLNEQSH